MAALEPGADGPTFLQPPLDEVVLGVQFDDQPVDSAVALADFWPRLRERFPRLEQQPPLAPAIEEFGAVPPAAPQIQLVTGAEVPRYWFVSADDRTLVQIQSDRLHFNWRRRDPETDYPRYEALVAEFETAYAELEAALESSGRAAAVPTWCEVSYINHLDASGGETGEHRPLQDFLKLVAPVDLAPLGAPEDTQLNMRYVIRNAHEPRGRLHVTVQPALRKADLSPIYALTLVARLRAGAPSAENVIERLGEARQLLGEVFVRITTDWAKERWEYQT